MWCSSLTYLFLCTILIPSSFSSGLPTNLSTVLFHEAFSPLYGDQNVRPYENGKSVEISMDKRSSSGFHSQQVYLHGLFSASIKFPKEYTAGVVLTFYTSNENIFGYHRDEIDFEFLGHIRGKNWVIQTNFYGNGSISRGREERYILPFDPSEDFHRYGILRTPDQIVYYVDSIPIRVVQKGEEMGGDFPSRPMTLYGTIWDGSNWATDGGKYKVDFKYGPFVAKYSDFVINGCPVNPTQLSPKCNVDSVPTDISSDERREMMSFRRRKMTYSYCYDVTRYPSPLPECVFDSKEAARLQELNPLTFGGAGHGFEKYTQNIK